MKRRSFLHSPDPSSSGPDKKYHLYSNPFTRRCSPVFPEHNYSCDSKFLLLIMYPSASSLPETNYNSCLQACIQTFSEAFYFHQTSQTPSAALQIAMTEANAQASAMGLTHLFPTSATISIGFHQDSCALPRQPFLPRLCTATRFRIRRITSTLRRLGNEIKEVTVRNGFIEINFRVSQLEDSCYIEYISVKQRWRAASLPSGIPLRVVQETELMQGCQQLVIVAGCVFKTAATTPEQHHKPMDIPGRCLKNVMLSLGFCIADIGSLYRVYTSRIGRSIQTIVTIVPLVDQHGENQNQVNCVESSALRTNVEVLDNENVMTAIHRLREQSRNSLITIRGQDVVKKKFLECSSIVLM